MDYSHPVPSDLTPEEKSELHTISMHKKTLMEDIQELKMKIEEVISEIEDFEQSQENKNVERGKQLSAGKKKFNMDPKQMSMYIQILKAFVELHEFTDLSLVQALRQFLWSFRLPGEAQKIDRMMETFASRYCRCNPNVFQSTDTCYILSFAIIMLNTSLHNPSVKDKPGLDRFISMNRGINNGEDLPHDLLHKLFESIRNEPFKIPEDDGNDITHTFFNPEREGWLLKLGGRVKTWKRRWFILTDSCLYYFEYTTDKEPRGIIPLENLCVKEVEDPRKSHCLELFNPNSRGQKIKACKTETDGRVVLSKHQSYKISAATAEEREQWIKSIRASITKDPFYDLVSTRKRKVITSVTSE
ncbi:cytohesin-4-like [Polyodon spathula]|uniref:cytohesin-4-like n=1 Tax=Polyodon spathula TaxID=7913 RepID=UPI001B7DFB25|nr:cytohesin-4-like [Polyodon spathula]